MPTNGNLLVDDLRIYVAEVANSNKMGEGGFTHLRSAADGGLAYEGFINIDRPEVSSIASGSATVDFVMTETIIHELTHVLGIGSLWGKLGLNSVRGQYSGAHALEAYRSLIGDPAAAYLPLDMSGLPGTDNAHWSEEIFGSEVMTGFYRTPGLKFSKLTIAGLEDLGYQVNYAAADSYGVAGAVVQPILNAENTGTANLYWGHAVI